MNETTQPYNEIDDYITAFSDEERQEYAIAETVLDLASVLYHIRQEQGLTQQSPLFQNSALTSLTSSTNRPKVASRSSSVCPSGFTCNVFTPARR